MLPRRRFFAVQSQRQALRAAAGFDEFRQRRFDRLVAARRQVGVQLRAAGVGDDVLADDDRVAGERAGPPRQRLRSGWARPRQAPGGRSRRRRRETRSPRPARAGRSTCRGDSSSRRPAPAARRASPRAGRRAAGCGRRCGCDSRRTASRRRTGRRRPLRSSARPAAARRRSRARPASAAYSGSSPCRCWWRKCDRIARRRKIIAALAVNTRSGRPASGSSSETLRAQAGQRLKEPPPLLVGQSGDRPAASGSSTD